MEKQGTLKRTDTHLCLAQLPAGPVP
jgi:hypothetical protein